LRLRVDDAVGGNREEKADPDPANHVHAGSIIYKRK